MTNRDIYVATTTFLARVDGKKTRIAAHQTFVRDGHQLLADFPDRFRKIEPQYETASTSASGNRRKPVDEPELAVLEPEAKPAPKKRAPAKKAAKPADSE